MNKKLRMVNLFFLIGMILFFAVDICASTAEGSTVRSDNQDESIRQETISATANLSSMSRGESNTVIYFLLPCAVCIICSLLYNNYLNIRRNEELRRANEAKAEFLSRMSHEIRTPLSAIIGLNNITAENIDNPECVQEYVEKVGISAKYLLDLLNDILDMSEINKGRMELAQEIFDLNELVEVIEAIYNPIAKNTDVQLQIDVKEDAKVAILGDELRMKQVIINLVSNGIKYNKPGGKIWLTVEKSEHIEEKRARFRITVEDNGIGISQENMEKIFDLFEREKSSDINMINGTGLGLTISAEILKRMDSRLNVESTPDKGSKFWFDIVLEVSDMIAKKEEPEMKKYDFINKNFLIVEDNQINATILEYILKAQGAKVDWACDGKVGCEMFEQSSDGYYSAILMDIRMPVMDGYEATTTIREMKREDAKNIQILAVSANAYQEDVRKCMETGMNGHCAKPVNREQLLGQLSS